MEVDVVNNGILVITDEFRHLNGLDFGERLAAAVGVIAWIA